MNKDASLKIKLALSALDPECKIDENDIVSISLSSIIAFCLNPPDIKDINEHKNCAGSALLLISRLNKEVERARNASGMNYLLAIGFHDATGAILIGGDSPFPLEELWPKLQARAELKEAQCPTTQKH